MKELLKKPDLPESMSEIRALRIRWHMSNAKLLVEMAEAELLAEIEKGGNETG